MELSSGTVQEAAVEIQPADYHMHVDSEQLAGASVSHVDNLRRSAALFLLTLKEKYKLTQTALNFAVGQVQYMVNFALEDCLQLASTQELPGGLSFNIDPFEDLKTEYMQTKFFKENFGLVVRMR